MGVAVRFYVGTIGHTRKCCRILIRKLLRNPLLSIFKRKADVEQLEVSVLIMCIVPRRLAIVHPASLHVFTDT
jgi:hypothetical protein